MSAGGETAGLGAIVLLNCLYMPVAVYSFLSMAESTNSSISIKNSKKSKKSKLPGYPRIYLYVELFVGAVILFWILIRLTSRPDALFVLLFKIIIDAELAYMFRQIYYKPYSKYNPAWRNLYRELTKDKETKIWRALLPNEEIIAQWRNTRSTCGCLPRYFDHLIVTDMRSINLIEPIPCCCGTSPPGYISNIELNYSTSWNVGGVSYKSALVDPCSFCCSGITQNYIDCWTVCLNLNWCCCPDVEIAMGDRDNVMIYTRQSVKHQEEITSQLLFVTGLRQKGVKSFRLIKDEKKEEEEALPKKTKQATKITEPKTSNNTPQPEVHTDVEITIDDKKPHRASLQEDEVQKDLSIAIDIPLTTDQNSSPQVPNVNANQPPKESVDVKKKFQLLMIDDEVDDLEEEDLYI